MRRDRLVASVVLTAALALVAVPGPAGSRTPSGTQASQPERFQPVMLDAAHVGTVPNTSDIAMRSASVLETDSVLREPTFESAAAARPERSVVDQPEAKAGAIVVNPWRLDGNVSWYGPGFYGHRTACGVELTKTVIGVAHRTLPCGTKVTFRNPATAAS